MTVLEASKKEEAELLTREIGARLGKELAECVRDRVRYGLAVKAEGLFRELLQRDRYVIETLGRNESLRSILTTAADEAARPYRVRGVGNALGEWLKLGPEGAGRGHLVRYLNSARKPGAVSSWQPFTVRRRRA